MTVPMTKEATGKRLPRYTRASTPPALRPERGIAVMLTEPGFLQGIATLRLYGTLSAPPASRSAWPLARVVRGTWRGRPRGIEMTPDRLGPLSSCLGPSRHRATHSLAVEASRSIRPVREWTDHTGHLISTLLGTMPAGAALAPHIRC